ncbi:hypothetical protein [Nocardioides houyundeii]|uniref:hypothetical protein n=1 Tax=Nocardioides houyundeii TaxID=2045452 RepID=UPI000DF14662|nr:hypothetical protein [Nocardioides houyundeii]
MSWTVATVVRLLVLAAGYGVALLLATGEDGLGVGLLLFAGYALVALVWSFFDARSIGFLPALVRWCVVAVVLAPVTGLAAQDGSFDLEVFLEDLATFVPFLLALIGVPAALGAAAGTLLRRRSSAPSQV